MFLAVIAQAKATLVIEDCPLGWEPFQLNCYQFNLYPQRDYAEAFATCAENGAYLVTIESPAEHQYITTWLKRHHLYSYMFYTGGKRNPSSPGSFTWTPTSSDVSYASTYWLSKGEYTKTGSHIVYAMNGTRVGWTMATNNKKLAYICEISKAESYRIIQQDRSQGFGEVVADPNDIKRGPLMTVEPKNTLTIQNYVKSSSMECKADGNPAVTYSWYKNGEKVTSATNRRYTITNGKLTFSNPNESEDADDYQCHATNEFGTILSSPAQLSFAILGQFPPITPEVVVTKAYDSAIVSCSHISFKPAVRYQWTKGDGSNFLRPELQRYIFISNNGKLYFSEIHRSDAGDYRCIVTLSGDGATPLETRQPPSRTSLAIEVVVEHQPAKAGWGPVIQNDFIAVFPSPPMRGTDVQLECFAQGTYTDSNPLLYFWSKDDGDLSSRVKFKDLHRVMIIENAQFEDEGTYRCIVKRGSQAKDEATYTLSLGSKPYFLFPLKSQFPDANSKLTWLCIAQGRPPPMYSWYKDGKLLKSIPGQIIINNNSLTIESINERRDPGMYQCGASNTYGTSFSSAQLKILYFAPRFIRHHLQDITPAAMGGNVSLICNPDAAPTATISWTKDGVPTGSSSGRVTLLNNGNLVLTQVMKSDEGVYTCKATNSLGSAEQSTRIQVKDHMVFVERPKNTETLVNETAFLYCTVSYNEYFETVHKWHLNGRLLDLDNNPTYKIVKEISKQGLYIRNANTKNEGMYMCTVENPLERLVASARLTVISTPGEAAGVYAEDTTITTHSLQLKWLAPPDNGSPVTKYDIQAFSNLDPEWKTVTRDIPDSSSNIGNEIFKSTTVVGLLPDNIYNFRLIAYNALGFGPASQPSSGYRMRSSKPTKAPTDVGGGGGTVGVLSIRWQPLHPSEEGAAGIGYIVYWREKENTDARWFKKTFVGKIGEFYAFVGRKYYIEYEVKVQAYNDRGLGPNSTISNVYSAEGMPIGVPSDVFADTYNSTAMVVSWTPVKNNRHFMNGKIAGYQVNWYDRDLDPENPLKYSQSFYGSDLQEVLVIGLIPNGYFWVTVQVFNTAGLGPVSESYLGSTGMEAPLLYPTEVNVYSKSENSVLVTFRGVSFGLDEGRIEGYKLCYWPVTEKWNPENHCVEFGKVSEAVIENIEKDTLYKLRVMGWSGDGDGKKSELVYFTLGGRVSFDPTLYDVLALGNRMLPSQLMIILTSLFCLLWQIS